MARKNRNQEQDNAEIDMTPMLDIVFIMLDFLYSYHLFRQGNGHRRKSAQSRASYPETICQHLHRQSANGEIWMDKVWWMWSRAAANIEKMLAEQPTDMVVIQADKEAWHGLVGESHGSNQIGRN